MKKIIFMLVFLLSFSSLIAYGDEVLDEDYNIEENPFLTEKAKVIEVGPIEDLSLEEFESSSQKVKLEILSGKYKGELFEVQNDLANNPVYDIVAEKGDKLVVMIQEEGDEISTINISDYYRGDYTLYMVIFFMLLLLLVGRSKGLKAIISLSLTLISIIYILLPSILKGMNPVPISILISIGITIITVFLVGGINKKSLSTIIGTMSGVIIAGSIFFFVGGQIKLTGLSAEEAGMLLYIPQDIIINFKSLLFSGIILGALGAIMDVGMSVSSSIDEIHKANKTLTQGQLFKSGMNVGKDIMGTMANTLILAYAGSSIPLLLLFMAHEASIVKIMNLDIIATEIVRSLSGSIGLVLTIPITAFVASFLIKRDGIRKTEV